MHRILVVEDEPHVRTFLGRALQKRGYQVLAVESAQQALIASEESDFDLLITDVGLPDFAGPELALLCRNRAHRTLPVVFISGYAAADLERRGIQNNDVVLTKPFGVAELHDAVSSALKHRGAEATP